MEAKGNLHKHDHWQGRSKGRAAGSATLSQNLGVLNLMIIAAFMFNFVNKKIHFNKKDL